MEIIENVDLKTLIAKTGMIYPVYIKITNGDNTGSDPDHPDFYRFDFDDPELSQIKGHEAEAFTTDKNNLGVNYFVTTIFKSRNINVAKFSCCEGNPSKPGRFIARMQSKKSLNDGMALFDWITFRTFEIIGKSWNKIDCGITVYGRFGADLPTKYSQLIPSVINGDLIFNDQDHSSTINPDISSVNGSVYSVGIKYNGWSPKSLGIAGKGIIFGNTKLLPNFSQCTINCDMIIYKSVVNKDELPQEINGNLSLVDCNLGNISNIPNVKKNLVIAADNSVRFSDLKNKPVIGGDLSLSENGFRNGQYSEEEIKSKFDIKGSLKKIDDSEIIKNAENAISKPEIGIDNRKLSSFAKAGVEAIEDSFGALGLAALKGIYKKATGRSLPGYDKDDD